MPDCLATTISAHITRPNCNHRPAKGTTQLDLVNFADIDKTTSVLANEDMLISTLALNTGKKFYKVDSLETGINPSHALSIDEIGPGYTHKQKIRVLDVNIAQLEQIQKLTRARVVAVAKTTDGGSTELTNYKVAGWQFGLKMTVNTLDYDTDGSILLEFTTEDGTLEPTGLKNFLMTDIATTEAFLVANRAT